MSISGNRQLEPTVTGQGSALPFGCTRVAEGTYNFSLYVSGEHTVSLLIRRSGHIEKISIDSHRYRTGDIRHIEITGLCQNDQYAYEIGESTASRADLAADPHARSLLGNFPWGKTHADGSPYHFSELEPAPFEWQDQSFPGVEDKALVIYELHVRGFTISPDSNVASPGTFSGLVEKIPYLKRLGINAVELLPVMEFDELDEGKINPRTDQALLNYWGYQPLNFFSPKRAYSNGEPANEFREMVQAFHEAGIEVILDVVFNHTGERELNGPFQSFAVLALEDYYLFESDGRPSNYSGCGNSFNANSAVGRELILASLRYWATAMHVDGFRFDLAAALTRDDQGQPQPLSPLIQAITDDPVLRSKRLIAEAWDAAGLYQVGEFNYQGRWYEWNGRFRDDIRRFIRGDGSLSALATRLTGSSDLFNESRSFTKSINFVTAHDGFTLRDLVTYTKKRNGDNGEDGRDGENDNQSVNCGVEGPSDDPMIEAKRLKLMKNYLVLLFISRGTPMLIAGDEYGRTQRGNNNAYCQDNPVSWFDWTAAGQGETLFDLVQRLIQLRKNISLINGRAHRTEFNWHGYQLNQAHWGPDSHWLGLHMLDPEGKTADEVYLIVNNGEEDQSFELPTSSTGRWTKVIETATRDNTVEIDKTMQNQSEVLQEAKSISLWITRS